MSKKASVAKAKEELRTIFDTNECEEVWLSDEEAEEDDDIFEGDDF